MDSHSLWIEQTGVLNELQQQERYAVIVAYKSSDKIYERLRRILQSTDKAKIIVPEVWLNKFSLSVMSKEYSELLVSGLDL
jgi:HKD family nuclease